MNQSDKVLQKNLKPYIGCTDITVLSFGASMAFAGLSGKIPGWIETSREYNRLSVHPSQIQSISIQLSKGLYKNSHDTAFPNGFGLKGLKMAVMAGLFLEPEKKLNLLSDLTESDVKEIKGVDIGNLFDVRIIDLPENKLYLKIKIDLVKDNKAHSGEVVIANGYQDIVELKQDDIYILKKDYIESGPGGTDFNLADFLTDIKILSLSSKELIVKAIEMNRNAYISGLELEPGLGIGARLQSLTDKGIIGNDISSRASINTAAAEDVRMGGENIHVMGIAGSGSHGIAASIPIITIAELENNENIINDERLIESLALSFLITHYVNKKNGIISAPCGCVLKAGIGAAAGIAYYLGGSKNQIENAINNFIISMTGVICDGAKTTCALKLSNSAACAARSALLALEGLDTLNHDGILEENVSDNINNLIKISHGMESIDNIVIDIIDSKLNDRSGRYSNAGF